MTERPDYGQHPELLLAGADRPRPLPPELRARLEAALLATDDEDLSSAQARPLSAQARGRLEHRLRPPAAKWSRRKWGLAGGAVAAAIFVLAAVVVPGLAHKPRTGLNAAAGRALSTVAAPAIAGAGNKSRPPAGPKTEPNKVPSRAARRAALPGQPRNQPGHQVVGTRKTVSPSPGAAPTPAAPARARSTAVPASHRGGLPVVAPAVLSVLPSSGPAAGGNWVVVRGQGLGGATAVYFGLARAPKVQQLSPGELRALVPAHSAATVGVIVARSGLKSPPTEGARYRYLP